LAVAEAGGNVPRLVSDHEAEWAEAARVGDAVSMGMRALALGRWAVGTGGLAYAQEAGREPVARQALSLLDDAVGFFEQQGMDPWALYAIIQQSKALADLRAFDQAEEWLRRVEEGLARFPVLASHLYEAMGQIWAMQGKDDAATYFQWALEAAEESGLGERRESLVAYLAGGE
jgi:hypothetical protein